MAFRVLEIIREWMWLSLTADPLQDQLPQFRAILLFFLIDPISLNTFCPNGFLLCSNDSVFATVYLLSTSGVLGIVLAEGYSFCPLAQPKVGEDESPRNKAEQGEAPKRVPAEHWRDVSGWRTEKVIPEIKISRCFLLLSYALGDKMCHFDEIRIVQSTELNYIIVNLEWNHFNPNLKRQFWGNF